MGFLFPLNQKRISIHFQFLVSFISWLHPRIKYHPKQILTTVEKQAIFNQIIQKLFCLKKKKKENSSSTNDFNVNEKE